MDELKHYGIKEQKWGVRRFQNPDGTLTEAGRERYNKSLRGRLESVTDSKERRKIIRAEQIKTNKNAIKAFASGIVGANVGTLVGVALSELGPVGMGVGAATAGIGVLAGVGTTYGSIGYAIIKHLNIAELKNEFDVEDVVVSKKRQDSK